MYIAPNTTIYLLNSIPLENNYENTIYFESKSAQYNYFHRHSLYSLNNYSYQRVNSNNIRVNYKADDLYNCNYMMFQNTNYGNKWFYAFITSIDYINNETSNVTYEIDVLQTWYFEYTLNACYIERQHTVTDNLWENLVPENINYGDDYVIQNEVVEDYSNMYICMLASETADGTKANGNSYNGVYNPLTVSVLGAVSDPGTINARIKEYIDAGKEDSIITIFQYPRWLSVKGGTTNNFELQTRSIQIPYNTTSINGYIPKNKKLFTYPYCKLLVSNNSGETAEFKWENWNDKSYAGAFTINGVLLTKPTILATPTNYRTKEQDYNSGLILSNFPEVPWVGDTYKAWLAQNKGNIASSMLSTVFSSALTAILAGTTGIGGIISGAAASTLVGKAASTIGEARDKLVTPPQVHGQTQSEVLNVALGRIGYSFQSLTIKGYMAEIVDNFFTMFGYAINKIGTPNLKARPHWTYIKTLNASLRGSAPANDANKITAIFNNGITFWVSGDEVGDYSLNNSPEGA